MKRLHLPMDVSARIAALSGAVFFLVTLATPDPGVGVENPTVTAVQSFYADRRTDLQLAFLLTGVAYVFFLVFLAVLGAELRRAGSDAGSLAGWVTASGFLVAGFHVLGTALWAAPGLQLEPGADPVVLGASTLAADTFRDSLIEISTFWRGLLLAGVAVLALRSRALSRWLGWFAAVLAAGAFVGSVGFLDSPLEPLMVGLGFGSYVGFHVWVLLASVALAMRHVPLPSAPIGP